MRSPALPGDAALSDQEIVARVIGGESGLFELILRRYNQRLYRAARAIVRDDAEAEDVLQETYLQAYAHLADFEGKARLSTWLTRIAINEALGRNRRRARLELVGDLGSEAPREGIGRERLALVRTSEAAGPEDETMQREMATLLEHEIDALPEGLRSVFMLRVVEGLSTSETAASLGLSEENVKVRLFRARQALEKGLYERAEQGARTAFPFLGARCDRMVARVMARLGLRPPLT